ncbi:MAG: carboxypeptidase-like regulatory domain-containing protein [Tannerella sp.]|nr:carboxypeptidase-like regulatory domain-containing protein [Tannerella sp.]
MKLAFVFLIVSLVQLSATTYAQNTKLSVSVKNGSLESVFKSIEEQSEFLFFYNARDIDKNEKISVEKKNSTIEDILKDIAAKTGIVYTIKDRHIVLTNHPEYLKAISSQSTKKQVTGIVVDHYGEPVISANVVEKGTTNGIVTDVDGKFSLSVEEDAILHVTYIGYVPQDVPVKNKSSFTITLIEDFQALEEVVVVGYGVQKKVNLTGSVATISSKERGQSENPVAVTDLVV